MRTRLVIAALAIPMALLSACGDDGGDATDPGSESSASDSPSESVTESPSAEPTDQPTTDPSADWPSCDSVWSDGAQLPRGYKGCRDGETAMPADGRACSFGRPLITFANRFYAVPTGVIHETAGALAKDPGYRSAMASCTA